MERDMPMPGHGGHDGGMDMDMQCSMNMVWNSATRGMCVVFSSWRVAGPTSLIATLLALFGLGMLLEYLRFRMRDLDARLLVSHNLAPGFLEGVWGATTHRRKASVQRVHSFSKSSGSAGIHGSRPSGISGPTSPLGLGRPTQADNSSTSSRSDDDAPLLPANAALLNRRKRKGLLGQTLGQRVFIPPLSVPRAKQLQRTLLFTASVALSMFLMLVFMTYNSWLIAAVLLGAGAGHYLFQRDLGMGRLSDEKGAACH